MTLARRLFRNNRIRPITPLEVPPASVSNYDLERMLERGKTRLDSIMTNTERTVAASQEHFAAAAAAILRGKI